MDTRKLSTSEGKGLSYCQILFVSKTGLNCEGWAQVLHTMAPNSSLWLYWPSLVICGVISA